MGEWGCTRPDILCVIHTRTHAHTDYPGPVQTWGLIATCKLALDSTWDFDTFTFHGFNNLANQILKITKTNVNSVQFLQFQSKDILHSCCL